MRQRATAGRWDVIQGYVLSEGISEPYVKVLEYTKESNNKIQGAKQQHIIYWMDAIEFIQNIGGVLLLIQNATTRSIDTIPQFS